VNRIKTIKIIAFLLIILLVGYFYSLELKKNWVSLQNFELNINISYLIVSLSFFLCSYLLDTYIWQVCINKHLGRHEINFPKSIAIVNSSGLLKYLPGRIWTFSAQLLWLKKYDISPSLIFYVNLICVLGSVLVSLYLGLAYMALYTSVMSIKVTILSFALLILFNTMYIIWNSAVINKLIALAGRLFKKEIRPLQSSRSLILYIQVIFVFGWIIAGFGSYFLAAGIGLPVLYSDMLAILASLSLAWVVGFLTLISPSGLGVREGMMLFLLNNVVNVQTALIFPILSRIMSLIVEAILGVTALSFGVKYNVFSIKKGD
jgi:uncharacterized membrane protein YbhN (UPF0104 family)